MFKGFTKREFLDNQIKKRFVKPEEIRVSEKDKASNFKSIYQDYKNCLDSDLKITDLLKTKDKDDRQSCYNKTKTKPKKFKNSGKPIRKEFNNSGVSYKSVNCFDDDIYALNRESLKDYWIVDSNEDLDNDYVIIKATPKDQVRIDFSGTESPVNKKNENRIKSGEKEKVRSDNRYQIQRSMSKVDKFKSNYSSNKESVNKPKTKSNKIIIKPYSKKKCLFNSTLLRNSFLDRQWIKSNEKNMRSSYKEKAINITNSLLTNRFKRKNDLFSKPNPFKKEKNGLRSPYQPTWK